MMDAIIIENLTKRFRNIVAVHDLNLTIQQGELFALLGMNGAGKTTTIKMLSCLMKPDSGDAILLGDSIIKNPRAVKKKTNMSPQETAIAPNLSVRENLEFMAAIYGSVKATAKQQGEEMLSALRLSKVGAQKARTLSGGMQRRLSIAMALISSPEILFLDEPTLGLDVLARRELWEIIRELRGKATIILTTHYMEEAEALSHRIGIMAQGTLQALGTSAELMEQTKTTKFEEAFVTLATEAKGCAS